MITTVSFMRGRKQRSIRVAHRALTAFSAAADTFAGRRTVAPQAAAVRVLTKKKAISASGPFAPQDLANEVRSRNQKRNIDESLFKRL